MYDCITILAGVHETALRLFDCGEESEYDCGTATRIHTLGLEPMATLPSPESTATLPSRPPHPPMLCSYLVPVHRRPFCLASSQQLWVRGPVWTDLLFGESEARTGVRDDDLMRRLCMNAVISGATTQMDPYPVLIFMDPGQDLDDELSLILLRALVERGHARPIGVVCNLAPSLARACLAKGTLTTLGLADVPVAAGSDGGCTSMQDTFSATAAGYMAPESAIETVTAPTPSNTDAAPASNHLSLPPPLDGVCVCMCVCCVVCVYTCMHACVRACMCLYNPPTCLLTGSFLPRSTRLPSSHHVPDLSAAGRDGDGGAPITGRGEWLGARCLPLVDDRCVRTHHDKDSSLCRQGSLVHNHGASAYSGSNQGVLGTSHAHLPDHAHSHHAPLNARRASLHIPPHPSTHPCPLPASPCSQGGVEPPARVAQDHSHRRGSDNAKHLSRVSFTVPTANEDAAQFAESLAPDSANNNTFDMQSAVTLYARLQSLGMRFNVLTRRAVSDHPIDHRPLSRFHADTQAQPL